MTGVLCVWCVARLKTLAALVKQCANDTGRNGMQPLQKHSWILNRSTEK